MANGKFDYSHFKLRKIQFFCISLRLNTPPFQTQDQFLYQLEIISFPEIFQSK